LSSRSAAPADDERRDPADLELKARLIDLLGRHRGNVAEVARAFGKGREQIHRWMRRYRVDPDKYRGG
jgi:transposase-like protein